MTHEEFEARLLLMGLHKRALSFHIRWVKNSSVGRLDVIITSMCLDMYFKRFDNHEVIELRLDPGNYRQAVRFIKEMLYDPQ